MDTITNKQNDCAWSVFFKHFEELVERINSEYIVDHLFSKRIITGKEYREFLDTNRPRHERSGKLLSLLPERCCLQIFLDAIVDAYPDLRDKLSIGCVVPLPRVAEKKSVDETNSQLLVSFAEKLKNRVLDGYAKDHIKTFEEWTCKLRISLQKCTQISRKQMIADCCFILIDTICVIERTHSENKNILWKQQSFVDLKSLISDCSNPELAQIKYYARYAMALLYGDELEQAKSYIDEAIDKLGKYLPGREVGMCYFVRVNLNLKLYTKNPSRDLKTQIIEDSERGYSFFRDDEDNEMRIKWWNVLLDKKLFCHLGIGLLLEDIPPGSHTCVEEGEIIGLLGEMRRHLKHIDKRRTMHYYKAEAKFYELKGTLDIAKGFLKEALKIAEEAGFKQEYFNLYDNLRRIHPGSSFGRCCNANNGNSCDALDSKNMKEDNNNLGNMSGNNYLLEEVSRNKRVSVHNDISSSPENQSLSFFDNNNYNTDALFLGDNGNLDNDTSHFTDMFLADIETPVSSKMDDKQTSSNVQLP